MLVGRNGLGRWLRLRDAEQFGGFGVETAKFGIAGVFLLHPLDCLVVPLASFVLVAEFPVGHRQAEPLEAVAAGAEFYRVLRQHLTIKFFGFGQFALGFAYMA